MDGEDEEGGPKSEARAEEDCDAACCCQGEEGDDAVQEVVAACGAHDDACEEGAEGDAGGGGDKAGADAGRGQVLDYGEVDGAVVEDGEDGHCGEPVCEAGGGDGTVEEELHGNDGFAGDAGFGVDEEEEGEGAKREGNVDERVVPGNDVAAGIEAEEEKDERGGEGESTEEVDALDFGLVGFFNGYIDSDGGCDAGDDDEGDLNVKGPAPAEAVVNEATKHASDTHAGAVD